MNLTEISKLKPAQQAAIMADQARATAARERIMAQAVTKHYKPTPALAFPGAHPLTKALDSLAALPAKSPPKALSAQMQAILPQCPGVKVKQPKVSETVIQQAVVRWFADNAYEWQLEPEYLMAIPNAGKRSARNGSRMVAEGLRAGAPDVLVAVPRGDCGGLFIELKTRDGVLSENQRLMLARLTKVGYATVVCRSSDEAIAAIRCYLNLPTPSKT